ncbi:unnamed protein product [Medioppia subpectinata]|uniref:glutathione transferase n=1 Tax=Medioppia subpectinata TaxID=1979941 RepID=A0A7R9L4Z9_9ACAR|nr:unnamed protein product [Medioppia subpectinata]CAG2115497.1 unnamed protein product [Medioppia subpectinata]
MSDTSVPTIGYYKTRGLAQPIRLLLAYKGVKFIDKYYGNFGDKNLDDNPADWLADKTILGLEFPDLPYYIDGPLKLTQSTAIMRHLARKHGLMATDETGLGRQDLLEQQLLDIRMGIIVNNGVNHGYDTVIAQHIIAGRSPQLDRLSRFLGARQWFTGNCINYVDFLAYEVLDWLRLFSTGTVDEYQNLCQFMVRFESLPPIKAYMKSSEFISWPVFPPKAPWLQ